MAMLRLAGLTRIRPADLKNRDRTMSHPKPATLGQLKETGYCYRTVKQELRDNLISRLKGGKEVFTGILGYQSTVVPQVMHAILSRHDMLFL